LWQLTASSGGPRSGSTWRLAVVAFLTWATACRVGTVVLPNGITPK
jgi:hypothetical protein